MELFTYVFTIRFVVQKYLTDFISFNKYKRKELIYIYIYREREYKGRSPNCIKMRFFLLVKDM